jgi:hypothetical protein
MRRMVRFGRSKSPFLLILLIATLGSNAGAQKSPDFAGEWVLTLGKRIFLAVSLTPEPGGTRYSGSILRPQHFSSANGGSFSSIKGPGVHYPIVRSAVKQNCLSFTTQNPSDKSDEDAFELCITGESGSLRIDSPGSASWPVTRQRGPITIATDWDSARTYFLDDSDVANPEMQQIFQADQKDRQPGIGKIDWAVVAKSDAARRTATARLLAEGKLHTGEDFERAAFVFQHGESPDDYLLAHTLAILAVARGQASAMWIAAATLDRYLQSINKPQTYGTQFLTKPKQATTQEPYNRGLVSDGVRRSLGVPSQAEQEEQRKRYDAESSSN